MSNNDNLIKNIYSTNKMIDLSELEDVVKDAIDKEDLMEMFKERFIKKSYD